MTRKTGKKRLFLLAEGYPYLEDGVTLQLNCYPELARYTRNDGDRLKRLTKINRFLPRRKKDGVYEQKVKLWIERVG